MSALQPTGSLMKSAALLNSTPVSAETNRTLLDGTAVGQQPIVATPSMNIVDNRSSHPASV